MWHTTVHALDKICKTKFNCEWVVLFIKKTKQIQKKSPGDALTLFQKLAQN